MTSSKSSTSETDLHALSAYVLEKAEEQHCSLPASWDRQKRLKYCYRLLKSGKEHRPADAINAVESEWPPGGGGAGAGDDGAGLRDDDYKELQAHKTRCVNDKNDQLLEALSEYAEVLSLLDHEEDAQLLSSVCDDLRVLGGAPVVTRKDALTRLKCRPDVGDIIDEFVSSGCIQRLERMKADL